MQFFLHILCTFAHKNPPAQYFPPKNIRLSFKIHTPFALLPGVFCTSAPGGHSSFLP